MESAPGVGVGVVGSGVVRPGDTRPGVLNRRSPSRSALAKYNLLAFFGGLGEDGRKYDAGLEPLARAARLAAPVCRMALSWAA